MYYTAKKITSDIINEWFNGQKLIKGRKKKEKGVLFYNTPCSFDIETSSFYEHGEKRAIMYSWQICIDFHVVIGRTWDDFFDFLHLLKTTLGICPQRRLIFYVHNLGYEFGFIGRRFEWLDVFAVESRKPVHAVSTMGFEFKCSYLLSGFSLAKVGENLTQYKFEKMVGDLDYKKIRHAYTPLTDLEIGYIVNDVLVVCAFVKETINRDGDILSIPLTKTGYVRNYCRLRCLGGKYTNYDYRDQIKRLILTPDLFGTLHRGFSGGFVHANAQYAGMVCYNVASYDICSSYPTVLIAFMFPMGKWFKIKIENGKQLNRALKTYCCVFNILVKKIRPRVDYENPLSVSKCETISANYIENNGRVVSADFLTTTITSLDYETLRDFYIWDEAYFTDFWVSIPDYLPTPFVETVLELYRDKTVLKGVVGKEAEYQSKKGMLNSLYGSCVQNPLQDLETYQNGVWDYIAPNIDDELKKYNTSQTRYLHYGWGVWCTALARRQLFKAIKAVGNDYVYTDTDSVKFLHHEKHVDFFKSFNAEITELLQNAVDWHGLNRDLLAPKTIDGKEKPIGIFEYEGTYDRFKTLGAKRYMTETNGDLQITVSGVNKKTAVKWLRKQKRDPFDLFDDQLVFPCDATGKNILTYKDEEIDGFVTDYTGIAGHYHENGYIHMEETEYKLGLSQRYVDYLNGIQESHYR